ncbi:hypothetical protein BDW74DRAFT_183964 [Aspergillus multicolor]|uniref:uncharacterized protein n=1 Tax=Aspergillus multicolor TaxID=41759 RepID=UPI003CCDA84F
MASITPSNLPKEPVYELDPQGDVILLVFNVPDGLPADLNHLRLSLLAGNMRLPNKPRSFVKLLVSKKALGLSSNYFAGSFNNPALAANQTEVDSHPFLAILHHDVGGLAFLIIMLIVHHRTRRVPLKLTLDRLIEVAHLTRYYKCHGTLSIWEKTWTQALMGSTQVLHTPAEVTARIMDWVYIAYAFHDRDLFSKTTKIAIDTQPNLMHTHLPLPAVIIDRMNASRLTWLTTLTHELNDLREAINDGCYRAEMPGVTQHNLCSYLVHGRFAETMLRLGLYPFPAPPFVGLRIQEIVEIFRDVEDWPGPSEGEDFYGTIHDFCRLSTRLASMLYLRLGEPEVLDIDDVEFPFSRADW